GLRAFAVLSVVAFHAFPYFVVGGFVGVDVFFVISGFLITSHIFENLDKGSFSFGDFYGRRIRRIFPSLIIIMIFSLVFGWFVLLADEFNQLGKHLAAGAGFISNFIFASEVGYFDAEAEFKPMLHLWSLAVEEQFYIFWPLILWLAWKIKLNLLLLCFLLMILSFSININLVEKYPSQIFFLPYGRFWELLVGSVLAWILLYGPHHFDLESNPPDRSKLANVLLAFIQNGFITFIGIVLLIASIFFINKSDPFPSYAAVVPVIGAVLIIIGGNSSALARLILSNKLAVWFGLISYPLYLWHWPILSYLHIIEDGTPPRDVRIMAVFVSIFLAWLTYVFIEKPIRFGKTKKKLRNIALMVVVLIIGLIGLIINYYDFSKIKSVDDVNYRKGLEHRVGSSSRWFKGYDGWFFLGNASNQTVAKHKLAIRPTIDDITKFKDTLSELSMTGIDSNTQIALLIGPGKSSIYSEKLPFKTPFSKERYIDSYLSELNDITNFTVYDPTDDLINVKKFEGNLYYKTDTHWNEKGSFISLNNLLYKLGYIGPKVEFSKRDTIAGDLIKISKIKDYKLENGDSWLATIDHSYYLTTDVNQDVAINAAFGNQEVVTNSNPIIDKQIWIIGDSFTDALKPYLNATFREVHYVGHWREKLNILSSDLQKSQTKPDIILIIKAERTF
ncbi:acyltransferase family protein, partial [Gammaproteobacteria bacterium]|nr:acyltransferase family protein [Gammaproteobacteria bacterium]